MGVIKSTRKILGIFINLRVDQWFGLKDHLYNIRFITGRARELFTPKEADRSETFEDAMDRLDISQTELDATDKYYSSLIYLFIFIAVAIALYSLYQALVLKSILSTIMTFSLVLFALANAFRYHFWRFQIRSKKLGCSFRDWLES